MYLVRHCHYRYHQSRLPRVSNGACVIAIIGATATGTSGMASLSLRVGFGSGTVSCMSISSIIGIIGASSYAVTSTGAGHIVSRLTGSWICIRMSLWSCSCLQVGIP